MINENLNLTCVVNLEEIRNALTYLKSEDLVFFIKDLDMMVADYDFTKELRDYFVKEMRKEDEVS